MILKMSKLSCLHLFLLGMTIVFVAKASHADKPPTPFYGEKALKQNPIPLHDHNMRHLLQGEVEEESPLAGEKSPENEGEKPGRLSGDKVEEESPFGGEKSSDNEGENPGKLIRDNVSEKGEKPGEMVRSLLANPPSMSPFAHMIKPSKGRVFKPSELRKVDGDRPSESFYVQKQQERVPLIMRHRKIPPRSLLALLKPHKQPNQDVMRREGKPPHEHKPGYEHQP
ncbi:hypothetical protein F3Y22_tig00110600pilonHSYRG00066 [Hibiscus syriacus]|uniref:Uncharacterized protein n=1 Tax=Hibiscus syriacus TaxID=106335 RepID=A0A6A3A1S5_HIBSY|nr:hypothetical protein F3Y22_tig00110600pilonHSYRG00066 [Hibiscus syriacus]